MAAILVLVATATIAIGLWKFKQMRARASHSGDGSVGWRAGGASKKARAPIAAPNLKAVEPTEIIRQAIVHAKRVDASAKLIDAHFPEVINGAVDVSGARGAGSKAFVRFEYRRIDKSKPAGEDVIQGNFFITAGFKGFSVWGHHKGHASHLKGSAKEAYPLPLPRCTAKQAWKVAVDSGVPSNAKTTLYWDKYQSYTADQTTDWSFRVKGHNEYRREIDATSCDLVGKWDASGNRLPTRSRSRTATTPRARRTKPRRRAQPVAPKPAAPRPAAPQPAVPQPAVPRPQPAGDCGCAKADLMCRMRCSSKR